MPSIRPLATLLTLLLSGATCLPGTDPNENPTPDPSATRRILFIGNSLTYVNDVPGMVKALADSAGISGVQTAAVAKPDYSLEDHWNDGQARQVVEAGGWTDVVLQQGPSAVLANRANLRQWAATFAAPVRARGGVPAMYSVWPQRVNFSDFEASIESYRLAAQDVDGPLLPAGRGWLNALALDANVPLYGPDGLHATVQGSYLAALSIFGALFQRPVTGLPRGLRVPAGSFQLSAEQAALLQHAADQANGRSP